MNLLLFRTLNHYGLLKKMPDDKYLDCLYRLHFNKRIDWENPKTFNEKLQWLKLYDRKPEYTNMVDKYTVKQYIADRIGEEYIIPTIGVWNSFEEIDFQLLPNKFVLKCTHDSGGIVICRDKSKFNIVGAKKKLVRCLNRNFYFCGREWPYKNVKPRIIAEKYMEDNNSSELNDYKFMCFNGRVKCIFVCSDRSTSLKVTFFNDKWEKMPFERHYPSSNTIIQKPNKLNEMIKLSEELAKNIPFVRVDFYEIEGKPYFGELTFFPGCGFEEFTPKEWDEKLGDWIVLPNKEVRKTY